jgi:methylglutaconyl-CoA hydratase
MNSSSILTHVDDRGVATLTMNRPELHNAFDDILIDNLDEELKRLAADSRVHVVCLAGSGKSFSAGADLGWMRSMVNYTREQNLSDAMAMADLMQNLNGLNKPTIALVHGAAYGGGVGLVACCDMALSVKQATFCFSEVRLGLVPSVISPYVIAAIGERACRRYFQSAEIFDAAEACRLGLVHEVVEDAEALQKLCDQLCDQLLKNGPHAMAEAKRLIAAVSGRPLDDTLICDTAARIADRRVSREGQEGLSAFLEKRKPIWSES